LELQVLDSGAPGARGIAGLWRPVAGCGGLWRAVAAASCPCTNLYSKDPRIGESNNSRIQEWIQEWNAGSFNIAGLAGLADWMTS